MPEKVDAKENGRYMYEHLFCYTRNNKPRLKLGSNRLFLGLTTLQKKVYTFTNKSICF